MKIENVLWISSEYQLHVELFCDWLSETKVTTIISIVYCLYKA